MEKDAPHNAKILALVEIKGRRTSGTHSTSSITGKPLKISTSNLSFDEQVGGTPKCRNV